MGENALRDGLCEDCGDDIALTDVQGAYSGKCAKCRDAKDPNTPSANWGGTADYPNLESAEEKNG